jgi:hypothetical protein
MMHGLGFISAWADYLNPSNPKSLTPQIVFGGARNQVQFEGFVEYAYDRQMKLVKYRNLYATNITAEMVSEFGHLGTIYPDTGSLGDAFIASPAYLLGVSMDANATTPNTIQQLPPLTSSSPATYQTNLTLGPPLILETGFRPFVGGSSLNHVSAQKYVSTADFLMRSSTPPGKTLADLIADYGDNGDSSYGPFGPGLRYVLASLGYRVSGGVPLGASTPNGPGSGNLSGANGASSNAGETSGAGRRRVRGWVYAGILGCWVIYLG